LVQLVLQEQQVHLVRKDLSEILVQQVPRELLEQQEHKELRAQLALKVEQVYQVQLVQLDRLEFKATLVQQDYKAQ
jgi:hypothetical protein